MSTYYDNLIAVLGHDLTKYEYMGEYTDKTNQKMNAYMLNMVREGVIYPSLEFNCVCTHWIRVNCYIRHIETKEMFTIGNCCIKRFGIVKKCSVCHDKHTRTKYNICKKCEDHINHAVKMDKLRIKNLEKLKSLKSSYESKIIKFGKYKNCTLKELLDDTDYVKWCLKTYEINYSPIFAPLIEYQKLFS